MVERKKPKYLFTCAGKEAWEYAKRYSKRQFPRETKQYFNDVIDVIEKLADSPHSYAYRDDLAAGTVALHDSPTFRLRTTTGCGLEPD